MHRTRPAFARLALVTCLAALPTFALAFSATGASLVTPSAEPRQANTAPPVDPSILVLVGLGLVGVAVFRARYRHEK